MVDMVAVKLVARKRYQEIRTGVGLTLPGRVPLLGTRVYHNQFCCVGFKLWDQLLLSINADCWLFLQIFQLVQRIKTKNDRYKTSFSPVLRSQVIEDIMMQFKSRFWYFCRLALISGFFFQTIYYIEIIRTELFLIISLMLMLLIYWVT